MNYVGAAVGQSAYRTQRESNNKKTEDSKSYQARLSRDERLVVEMKIPLTASEIIEKPMEEFNDLLSSGDITEEQINTCRDIRRRGKNKVRMKVYQICQILLTFNSLSISDCSPKLS